MQEEKNKHPYKIMIGDRVRIFKKLWDNKVYYSIQISQKNYDGTIAKYYRPIAFKKGVEIDTNTDIIIKDMFENLRVNKNDKYNPITSLMITEFETVENAEKIKEQSYENYQNALSSGDNEYVPTITEEDLPF